MVDSWIIALELGVSTLVAFSVLFWVIWGLKTGQFDDGKRLMNGLLYDNEEDLNDAVRKENKKNKADEKLNEK